VNTTPRKFKNQKQQLIWKDHQSDWSSAQKLSCNRTPLNHCTTTERRWNKKNTRGCYQKT